MFSCINFQLKPLLFLDEYIKKVSQGSGEGNKKEKIWLLYIQRVNYLSDYLQRKN